MSNNAKFLTKDENKYKKFIDVYGINFVNKYEPLIDKVLEYIDLQSNIETDFDKIKLFSKGIEKYIEENKNSSFFTWDGIKLMFDFISIDDLPEMKMFDSPDISINKIIRKYGINNLANSGLDIDCLFKGRKIMDIDELNSISGLEFDDIKKFVYSSDAKVLNKCKPEQLLKYGINNFMDLSQNVNLYKIRDMLKIMPIDLIKMGANSEIKKEFINKYGIDNILRLDEETGQIFSHKYDDNNIYLNIIAVIDKLMKNNNNCGNSYEDFRNKVYKMLIYVRDEEIRKKFGEKINYNFIKGKFREDYQDIFIDNVSEDIEEKFYNGKLNAQDIKNNPEIIEKLKDKRLFFAWNRSILKNSGSLKKIINTLGNEDFLRLCSEYGGYFDNIDIEFDSIDMNGVGKLIEDKIYDLIKNNNLNYDEDLPKSFINKHSNLFFLEDEIDNNLKKKFYNGNLDLNDVKNNPELTNILINKECMIGFRNIKNGLLFKMISINGILELAEIYGNSLLDISNECILKYLEDGDLNLIDAEIEKNIIGRISKYDENVPDFFKNKYPKMFLDENAPQELKDLFYENGNKSIDFDIIRENPEWIKYLRDKDLKRAFSSQYGVIFEKIVDRDLIDLEIKNPGVMSKMINNYSVKDFMEWYKYTDGKFFPNSAIMAVFPTNEISSFLKNAKKWSKLVREIGPENDEELVGILKIAYSMGVFHGNEYGYSELLKVFRNIPGKSFNLLNSKIAEKLFGDFNMKYNPEFVKFFYDNLQSILSNEEYMKNLHLIQKRFEDIISVNAGRKKKVSLEMADYYVKSSEYMNVDIGNEGLAEQARIVGYTQEQFENIQKIFNEGSIRTYLSIPRILGERNGMKYEILRSDDPLALTIGELTNCCQRIGDNGSSCMEHSVISPDGRVFCVRDDKNRIIAQSWVWRNQNVICFDNIEIPEQIFSKLEKENLIDIRSDFINEILSVYKKAAQDFMKIDRGNYKKLLDNNQITKEEYNSNVLKKVTMGGGYNDISNAIKEDNELLKDRNIIGPKFSEKFRNLYIKDSKEQYIIISASNNEDVKIDNLDNLCIYADDIPVYDINNMTIDVIYRLKRMDNSSNYESIDGLVDIDDNNMLESERAINIIASKYQLCPKDTKIMLTNKIGLIYSMDDGVVGIADLLIAPEKENLSIVNCEKIKEFINFQIKKALEQIDVINHRIDISELSNEKVVFLNDIMSKSNLKNQNMDYDDYC